MATGIRDAIEAAAALHRQGRLDDAARACEAVLAAEPASFNALSLFGVVLGGLGRLEDAAACFTRAAALRPQSVQAQRNLATTWMRLQRFPEAVAACRAWVALEPREAGALGGLGAALMAMGRPEEALGPLRAASEAEPGNAARYRALADAHVRLDDLDAAAAGYRRALAVDPGDVAAHLHLGAVLARQDRHETAIECFRRVLELAPDNADALDRMGLSFKALGRNEEAAVAYQRALAIRPESATIHFRLGNALAGLGRDERAAESYRLALALKPDYAEAANNLGNALTRLGRNAEAATSFRRAAAINPAHAGALNNLGNALMAMGQAEEAVTSFRRALDVTPARGDLHSNLGNALLALSRYDEALASFRKAVEYVPDHPNALSQCLHTARLMCDWQDHARQERDIVAKIMEAGLPFVPFPLLSVVDDPAVQLRCARQYWAHRRVPGAPAVIARRADKPRLTLGYISADFSAHPVAALTARMFELHDRERFAVHAFAHGRNDGSAVRRRLEQAFDGFHDVWQAGDGEIAQRVQALGIDILVDLTGHTSGGRLDILARRPAPIQVHYLGYPGTLGVDFIDYTLADRFVVPPDQRGNYTEQVVYLPGCFQINDSQRKIGDGAMDRAAHGLPAAGFVFCSFNHSYKMAPAVFDVWMRLLGAAPGSVLWLPAANRWAEENLRREAQARGIDPTRLIFAPRLNSQADHLARYRLADLFLDTLPYNAHTTASDALAAGLPVLTCAGRSLAARVAGSLLHAVGLPELVTDSLQAYEALGLRLVRSPAELAGLRARLAVTRRNAAVFDSARTTRHIEAAYRRMWEIHCRGEPPRSFAVAAA